MNFSFSLLPRKICNPIRKHKVKVQNVLLFLLHYFLISRERFPLCSYHMELSSMHGKRLAAIQTKINFSFRMKNSNLTNFKNLEQYIFRMFWKLWPKELPTKS